MLTRDNRLATWKVTQHIVVLGWVVREENVADIIVGFGQSTEPFKACDLVGRVYAGDTKLSYQMAQEVLNRLCQRWRKLDMITFDRGRWRITNPGKFKTAYDYAMSEKERKS